MAKSSKVSGKRPNYAAWSWGLLGLGVVALLIGNVLVPENFLYQNYIYGFLSLVLLMASIMAFKVRRVVYKLLGYLELLALMMSLYLFLFSFSIN